MGLYCEIPGDIERTFIKEGERRLPFVSVATFGGATGPRLVGWGGRQPGSILRAKHNLCKVGIFIGGPGHSLHGFSSIFPYTS